MACGVRKVWAKEFKGVDRPSDQIRRLRQILADLGMKGRMSLEQAKAIRQKREFEQELGARVYLRLGAVILTCWTCWVDVRPGAHTHTEDVKEFAEKMESANRRRSAKGAAAAATAEKDGEDEDDEESDIEIPPKRRVRLLSF